MSAELKSADPIYWPSLFWEDLAAKNVDMLQTSGIENFKRTVSQNYFNWLIDGEQHPYFIHMKNQCLAAGVDPELPTTLSETNLLRLTTSDEELVLTPEQRDGYRRYATMVWQLMTANDQRNIHHEIQEPLAGNPFPLMSKDRLISQDLANSIVEFNTMADYCPEKPQIAEIGAGYGRLAYVFANKMPGLYCIFDIPPALAVAQWYAIKTLGEDAVFQFRSFSKFSDIKKDLMSAKVAFFTANQIKQFDDGFFDLVTSISTLPELRREQADVYIDEMQRLSKGHIFLKQWQNWRNPLDDMTLTPGDYRFGEAWTRVLEKPDPIIPDFVNIVWKRAESAKERGKHGFIKWLAGLFQR